MISLEPKVATQKVSLDYSSMRFVGVSLGPPMVSILSDISHLILFYTLSGISAVGFVLTTFAIKPKQGAPKINTLFQPHLTRRRKTKAKN